jgi:hypothetical protein
MVGIRSMTTGHLRPLDFRVEGEQRFVTLPIRMSVTGPESYLPTVRLGLGIAQLPRFHVEEDLARGTLVPMLPEWPPEPMPVSILYPRNRQLSPRVRVFIDWLAERIHRRCGNLSFLLGCSRGEAPRLYSRGDSPPTPVANSSCASAVRYCARALFAATRVAFSVRSASSTSSRFRPPAR